MALPQILVLFVASILGGILNAVAGGGSFFTFPSLIVTGISAIQANATSTVALWPGTVASVGAYRRELTKQKRGLLFLLVGISLVGGVLGAILLLKTSQAVFVLLIPYLLLLATLLFAFSGPITARLRARSTDKIHLSRRSFIGLTVAQFIISIYGGYFGGGIGILMLATLAMMGLDNIHEMNALKTLLASCINGIAVVTFIIAGAIVWPQAILMIVGAILGGYGGAYYARKIDPRWVRLFVIVVGIVLTIYFFLRR
ncbi:MAG TPA: sulfite exporter TauE/SafE family protein [Ktedonobacteraceae bacterium]|nr:sulfite exporter TauE/SafE family protein [Ktedonobacteraceae bacterium]